MGPMMNAFHANQQQYAPFAVSRRVKPGYHSGANFPMYRTKNLRSLAKDCMLRMTETKHIVTNVTGVVPAGGAVYGLNGIATGTTTTTRVGN